MFDSETLAKAQLGALDANTQEVNEDTLVTVQFNPETLKVSFTNQIVAPSGDQKGTKGMQFVGAGTTKLSLQLWFDVTAPLPEDALPKDEEAVDDVRKLTKRVAFFITPMPTGEKGKSIPPLVRFLWGSFQFDGIMESLEESLEFFSPEGRPLRASMTLSLTQQKIEEIEIGEAKEAQKFGGPFGAPPGTQPHTQAPAGSTLQGLAASQGMGDDWQSVAIANGIENPRLLAPGQLINMIAKSLR